MRLNDDCERGAEKSDGAERIDSRTRGGGGEPADRFADERRRRGACIGTAFCIRTETANLVSDKSLPESHTPYPYPTKQTHLFKIVY